MPLGELHILKREFETITYAKLGSGRDGGGGGGIKSNSAYYG